ncbi:hypothetical protein CapIbe_013575 [Capra ibex]
MELPSMAPSFPGKITSRDTCLCLRSVTSEKSAERQDDDQETSQSMLICIFSFAPSRSDLSACHVCLVTVLTK